MSSGCPTPELPISVNVQVPSLGVLSQKPNLVLEKAEDKISGQCSRISIGMKEWLFSEIQEKESKVGT